MAQRLAALNRRRAVIRRRVISISISMFAVLWLVIFAQLVSGHDPALARSATKKVAVASSSTNTSGSSTSTSTSGSGSTAGSAGAGSTTAVTTSQS